MNESAPQWFEDQFLAALGIERDDAIRPVVQQLVRATVHQHSCLSVPDPALLELLQAHEVVGAPDARTPLILEHDNLYLARYHQYEREVAAMMTTRNRAAGDIDTARLREGLTQEFGAEPRDRQKLAALLALTRQLCIITGGPGTGKTSTVVKILKLLFSTEPGLRVHLAAPTGKAAMRLSQSIASHDDTINPEVKTLHRLLGMRRDGRTFQHGPDFLIPTDLLIVDEASMIDLPMMHRLLLALPETARLILLGDPNQLPSVDTGNVLADLCRGDNGFSNEFARHAEPLVGEIPIAAIPTRLTDAIGELTKSYRFTEHSSIGRLARAIEQGETSLVTSDDGTVTTVDLYAPDQILDVWQDYLALLQTDGSTADQLLRIFEQTRLLCSRRSGTPGVETINLDIESALETLNLKATGDDFYHGRPVMVTRNDYNLGLFNGDIGICTAAASPGHYQVHFADGREYPVSRLPAHETCFAMTVHKAQGSEFDRVVLIMTDETGATADQLLNRELLYTAVTRAKSSIVVVGDPLNWQRAMTRSAARHSGMTRFLQGASPDQSRDTVPTDP